MVFYNPNYGIPPVDILGQPIEVAGVKGEWGPMIRNMTLLEIDAQFNLDIQVISEGGGFADTKIVKLIAEEQEILQVLRDEGPVVLKQELLKYVLEHGTPKGYMPNFSSTMPTPEEKQKILDVMERGFKERNLTEFYIETCRPSLEVSLRRIAEFLEGNPGENEIYFNMGTGAFSQVSASIEECILRQYGYESFFAVCDVVTPFFPENTSRVYGQSALGELLNVYSLHPLVRKIDFNVSTMLGETLSGWQSAKRTLLKELLPQFGLSKRIDLSSVKTTKEMIRHHFIGGITLASSYLGDNIEGARPTFRIGYPFLSDDIVKAYMDCYPEASSMQAKIKAFIEEDQSLPTVFASFGSMQSLKTRKFANLLERILNEVNNGELRLIYVGQLNNAVKEMIKPQVSKNILECTAFIPYEALFEVFKINNIPIIITTGEGNTSHGVLNGLPILPAPAIPDQVENGKRLVRTGHALVPSVFNKRGSIAELAAQTAAHAQKPAIQRFTQELSGNMRGEDPYSKLRDYTYYFRELARSRARAQK